MIGAPKTKHEIIDENKVVIGCVDRRGREMHAKWGYGVLPTLVPIEWAKRFRSQQQKFDHAVWDHDVDAVARHGEAMLRAYDKLDALAVEAGHKPADPDVWEFQVYGQTIALVRDIADVGRVDTKGRDVQVWSVDEIGNVIRAASIVVEAKHHFPGAEVQSVRPPVTMIEELNDELTDIPF